MDKLINIHIEITNHVKIIIYLNPKILSLPLMVKFSVIFFKLNFFFSFLILLNADASSLCLWLCPNGYGLGPG